MEAVPPNLVSTVMPPLPGGEPPIARDRRKMVPAVLLGKSTHVAGDVNLHIVRRDDTRMARGRYLGKQFGVTLGRGDEEAERNLRHLIDDLEQGRFVPPSQRPKSRRATYNPTRIRFADLLDEYLPDVERRCGFSTARTYGHRLRHGLRFYELTANKRRWPFVETFDQDAALSFKDWLAEQRVTGNGRDGAESHPIARYHQVLILNEIARMLRWAMREDIRKLPLTFRNPFNGDIVGKRAPKDPLALKPLDLDTRVRLVGHMDLYQLKLFALPFVLPNRLGEWASLLISAVSLADQRIAIGHMAYDPPKARKPFTTVFPIALTPLISVLIGGREEGPLFVPRTTEERGRSLPVIEAGEIKDHMDALPGKIRSQPNDCKGAFRAFLVKQGGISDDQIGNEFKALRDEAGLSADVTFHDLRSSVSRDLKRAGVEAQTRGYLCGRVSMDIQFGYEGIEDLARELAPYFLLVKPLTDAISLWYRDLTGQPMTDVGLSDNGVWCTVGAHQVHEIEIYDLK